ncbi:MAG: type II toxin-antitoxin system PemK/MazF family toxin [Elusimicrobia bacterium]|nr:type II toxin-antitoxin system PemK/MazF family toxin [Elusimicrobiota bacterium]
MDYIRRGRIYRVRLNPVKGREQAGQRPALVVSSDAVNRQPLVVTVVVGTDAANVPRDYPTNVRVSAAETGLPLDTVFLCFQLRSLDRSRFLDPEGRAVAAGVMPEEKMRQVEAALRLVLDLHTA